MAGLELWRARAKVVAVPSEAQVAQFGLSFSDDVAFAEQDLGIDQRNASPALPSLHRTIAPEREPYRSPPSGQPGL